MGTNTTTRVTTSPRRPMEDIDAILGKFSAWSSSQGVNSGPQPRVSEVSYEQALHATRFRRNSPEAIPSPEIAADLAPAVESSASAPQPPARRRKKTTQAAAPARTRKKPRPHSTLAAEDIVRGDAACKEPVAGHPNFPTDEAAELLIAKAPEPRETFAGVMRQEVHREMARELERDSRDLARNPSKNLSGDLASPARSVSLTVRLAPEECALVKARAGEAGISVSAYVRQCALDVDLLREHVETVLAEIRAANTKPNLAPCSLPAMAETPRAASQWSLRIPKRWLRWGAGVLDALRGRQHFEGAA